MKDNSELLLVEIKQIVGCSYLSDLHSPTSKAIDYQVKSKINSIPDDKYTLDEWNSASTYILNTQCRYNSVEEAKCMILNKYK